MWPQDVRRETVRACAGLALRIRDQVHLAVGLLEGLANAVVFEPAAPMQNGLDVRRDRMPEPGGLLGGQVDFPPHAVGDAAVVPDAGSRVELPDYAAGHVGQQR